MTQIKEFKSDGCSGGMSLFWRKVFKKAPPWEGCCRNHDVAYHQGGTVKERWRADVQLMCCVAHKGYPTIGFLMYLAVRIGGLPIFPTSYRWGFGRPYLKSCWYDKD